MLSWVQGSHVLQFGDMVIDEEPAADYLGKLNTGMPPCKGISFVVHGQKDEVKIAWPCMLTKSRSDFELKWKKY